MNRWRVIAAASFALLVLTACSTSMSSSAAIASSATRGDSSHSLIHGTVRSVDSAEKRIPFRQSLEIDPGDGSSRTIEYTASTPVTFNGSSYAPTDLEPGDEIDIVTTDLEKGRVGAREILVTRAANGIGNESLGPPATLATLRGTVSSIDTTTRTIELDRSNFWSHFRPASGTTVLVQYGPDVSVGTTKGQVYPVTSLKPGDLLDMQVQITGSTNYRAQRILVRNVNRR